MSDFWARAACRKVAEKNIFFPEPGDPGTVAKLICAHCPIRRECLDWALDHREDYGIFGGTTGRERIEMRKLRV
jgi:WhiB family redox-sensing transcriptional regulator